MKFGNITDIHDADIADAYWGGGGLGPVQWRKYSTAGARLTAFCNAMQARGDVDFCIQMGDFVDGSANNTILERIVQVVTDSNWTGLWYNMLGNHEQGIWGLDFSDYESRINNSLYDDPYVQNSADMGYSFDVEGIHFVVMFATGLTGPGSPDWTAQDAWLIANLAATSLPVVILIHADPSGNLGDLSGYTTDHDDELRTIFENSGKVQAVISGHYHWAGFDIVINNIPYYHLRGSVLSDTSEDSHNAYYLFEIIPNAVYTANGMKANIKITGYEEGSGETIDFIKYMAVGA